MADNYPDNHTFTPPFGNPDKEFFNWKVHGPQFHGTSHEMAPGSVVEPRSKKVAHATPSLRTARVFGERVYEVSPVNRERTWAQPMKHTGNESHTETLSEEGFMVIDEVPKSRSSEFYNAHRQGAEDHYWRMRGGGDA